jgi:hypothetical protein
VVEKEKTTDYNCSQKSLVKKWKGKQYRLAHFLVALALVVGGLLVASYAYNQYSQSNVTTQLIGYNMAYQNGLTVGIGNPSIPRTDDIVPVAQSGWYNGTHTAAGTIDIVGENLPTEIPLCITNQWLSQYWVAVNVTGGYTPYDGSITVWQKGDRQGTIWVHWTCLNPHDCCCVPKEYKATFSICGWCPICVDSDQYPAVGAGWTINTQGNDYIPGKAIDLQLTSKWMGCYLPEQAFVIIPVQNN